eukprot:CAMPEP_0170528572 /NCGR_PEP_ID=MMETSP0209-20121228/14081_1 /TAXON_ID=665100 ORGANISM="Litonotus pictus, Strain P1" /NCGR_SAMPLE_ID=MMETSP0209 /ASSEMBLY_ACC=CAM_ASM_000301 /LENGTH=261 /DNA_ID=CAMNT_0010819889 /DNA_START=156 /DNA_END=938 /DNA_ORIENTATION=-
MKGSFKDRKVKERMIVNLLYLFFSRHSLSKIHEAKKEYLSYYFEVNKHNMLYFWYSVEAMPRILNYLLVQSLTPVLLPKEDEDLEFFFGGHNIEGFFGVNSPHYVAKKIKDIFPNSNLQYTELLIKDFMLSEEDSDYIQDMIKKEKINEEYPEDVRELLEIKPEFVQKLKDSLIQFFNPYVLYDIYVGNEESVSFLKGKYDGFNVRMENLEQEEKEKREKMKNNIQEKTKVEREKVKEEMKIRVEREEEERKVKEKEEEEK